MPAAVAFYSFWENVSYVAACILVTVIHFVSSHLNVCHIFSEVHYDKMSFSSVSTYVLSIPVFIGMLWKHVLP